MGDKGNDRSLLRRILSDRNIQLGAVFLSLALIFAYVGALPESGSTTDEGTIKVEDCEDSDCFREIRSSLTAVETIIEFNYTANESDPDAEAEIWFEDGFPYEEDSERVRIPRPGYEQYDTNITLSDGENVSQDLNELEDRPRTVNFNLSSGELEYSHTIRYQTKPYGLLSFPALLFLLIGMVYAFKGQSVIAAEIKRKRMREEEKAQENAEEKEEEKEQKDEEISGGKTIYSGEDKSEDAEHIDFMGISGSSDEENEK